MRIKLATNQMSRAFWSLTGGAALAFAAAFMAAKTSDAEEVTVDRVTAVEYLLGTAAPGGGELPAQSNPPGEAARQLVADYVARHLPEKMTWRTPRYVLLAFSEIPALDRLDTAAGRLEIEGAVLRIRQMYDFQLSVPPLPAQTVAELENGIRTVYDRVSRILVESLEPYLPVETITGAVNGEKERLLRGIDNPRWTRFLRKPMTDEQVESLVAQIAADLREEIPLQLECIEHNWGRLPEAQFRARKLEAFRATLTITLADLQESLEDLTEDVSLRTTHGHAEKELARVGDEIQAIWTEQYITPFLKAAEKKEPAPVRPVAPEPAVVPPPAAAKGRALVAEVSVTEGRRLWIAAVLAAAGASLLALLWRLAAVKAKGR
jgi:hypothetical protein